MFDERMVKKILIERIVKKFSQYIHSNVRVIVSQSFDCTERGIKDFSITDHAG